MEAAGLDAFLVTQKDNRRYLSAFTGSNGILLVTKDRQIILTDFRYYEQVEREAPGWELIKAGRDPSEDLVQLIPELQLTNAKIGFEADHVTVLQFYAWIKALPEVELVETNGFVLALRKIKTEPELAAIQKAVALVDEAIGHIYDWIQPGMTEKEIAWELEVFMRSHGAAALSFETIVAAGPNSALPHATPSDYEVKLGDVVLIDTGCVIDGYCSDITRTFSLGEPNHPEFLTIWQLVNRANAAAARGIKAGISSKDADSLARDLIKEAGYGDDFGHSLGHGVGLAIHEAPKVSYLREDALEAGSVITIEPGVYLSGAFGVRIEDMAVITQNGLEILTTAPKIDILPR